MKKQILAVAMATLFASAAVMADPLPAGGVIQPADCATIGSPVTINLSNGVSGAFTCNAIGNAAALSTCHANGSRQTRVFGCTSLDAGPDAVSGNADDEWNDDSCPTGDGSADPGQFTIDASFRGFAASTSGGGVGAVPLLGGCDEDTVDAILPTLN
jgi:hypothetical protein